MGAEDFKGVTSEALLTLLISTTDSTARNALAIELADRNERRAIPALLFLVDRCKGKNGSLIYALREFGPAAISQSPWELMNRIADDETESFEAQMEAQQLIDALIES